MNTRFHIPDFNPLYNEVREYVREKQGEKEMVWLDFDDKDKCYALIFNYAGATEEVIQSIRVTSFKSFSMLQIRINDHWYNITESAIYAEQTLINIAKDIESILEDKR